MSHPKAKLTPQGRLLVVQRATEHRRTPSQTAEAVGISRATVYKWLHRYREEGEGGLQDRSSRPRRSPRVPPLVSGWRRSSMSAGSSTSGPTCWRLARVSPVPRSTWCSVGNNSSASPIWTAPPGR